MEQPTPPVEENPVKEENPLDPAPAPAEAVDNVIPEISAPSANTVTENAVENPVTKPPVESLFSRVLHAMFSPETRLGRVLRPVLRWAAAIVGLFALGLIAAYLLLYRPVLQQLSVTNADLDDTRVSLADVRAELAANQKSLADIRVQYKNSQDAVQKSAVRIGLLKTFGQVQLARLGLVNRDGAGAQKALVDARTYLDTVLAEVKKVDSTAATLLDSRMTLVMAELNDPKTALADLDILSGKLQELDSVFK